MVEQIVVLVFAAFLPAVVYIYTVYLLELRSQEKKFVQDFFKAASSVIKINDNIEDCVAQINLNFKKISEKYPSQSSDTNHAVDLLEELVSQIDINGKKFLEEYKLEITKESRNQILQIIEHIKSENPYVTLSQKQANLLNSIQLSINPPSPPIKELLNQIADEFSLQQRTIIKQERNLKRANFLAAVGLIATLLGIIVSIYFGLNQ